MVRCWGSGCVRTVSWAPLLADHLRINCGCGLTPGIPRGRPAWIVSSASAARGDARGAYAAERLPADVPVARSFEQRRRQARDARLSEAGGACVLLELLRFKAVPDISLALAEGLIGMALV